MKKSRIMKYMLAAVIVPAVVFAGPEKNVAELFNMTGNSVFMKNGKWFAMGMIDEIPATVDIPNGYIEVVDHGTGGGTVNITAALFTAKDKPPVLAVFKSSSMGIPCGNEFTLTVHTLKGGKLVKAEQSILPPLPVDPFFKKGFNPDKLSRAGTYGNQIHIAYKLPRHGTTIEAYLEYACLEWIAEGGGPSAELDAATKKVIKEIIANVRKTPLLIKWNMQRGAFDIGQ